MNKMIEEDLRFAVRYHDETHVLCGRLLRPAHRTDDQANLPPVLFNSGFTGGASMYGQLVGRALAACGFCVMTYDVAGFYKNKTVRQTRQVDGRTLTEVSLRDQKDEVLAAIAWVRQRFERMPVVISWAMGTLASLAAITDLARPRTEQIPYYIPMNYTRMQALQDLRADAQRAHADLMALADDTAIPPFDLGTEQTRLGYYPLDPETQAYVDQQLGGYTDQDGVERWPGCAWISARSYKESVQFDPERDLHHARGVFPPALIVHGARNTLHQPAESIRLHQVYPGAKSAQALIINNMAHGQELQANHPVFQALIAQIDQGIRKHVT